MRKLLFILTVFVCGAMQGVVAQDMRSLFLDAPDEVFPLLTNSSRADCVDYVDAGMEARVTNRLDGTSILRALTRDYMYVETSASSWLEAALLPSGGDTLVCVVKGVRAEAADSRLLFYDRSWRPLLGDSLFYEPMIDDFFASADSAARYSGKCDIYLVKYSLAAGGGTLVAEYTMPAYMNDEDASIVAPLLRTLTYRWNGKRFVRE